MKNYIILCLWAVWNNPGLLFLEYLKLTFGPVKHFIAISLLFVHLFTATEIYQLLKFPLLLEHFREHKDQDADLSFYSFLKIHYADKTIIDEDHDQDMKLPFKTDDGCINTSITALVSCPLSEMQLKPFNSPTKIFFSYNESLLPSSFLSSIWQPPKVSWLYLFCWRMLLYSIEYYRSFIHIL